MLDGLPHFGNAEPCWMGFHISEMRDFGRERNFFFGGFFTCCRIFFFLFRGLFDAVKWYICSISFCVEQSFLFYPPCHPCAYVCISSIFFKQASFSQIPSISSKRLGFIASSNSLSKLFSFYVTKILIFI
jgi:hypothetical protein